MRAWKWIIVSMAMVVASLSQAALRTFNGSVSGDWSNSANWDGGVGPGNGDGVDMDLRAGQGYAGDTGPFTMDYVVNGQWASSKNGFLRFRSDGADFEMATGSHLSFSNNASMAVYNQAVVLSTNTRFSVIGSGNIMTNGGAVPKDFKLGTGSSFAGTATVEFIADASGISTIYTKQLTVSTAGTELIVDLSADTTQAENDTYTLFDYSLTRYVNSNRGDFSSVSVTGLGAGLDYSLDYGSGSADQVVLTLTAIPEVPADPVMVQVVPVAGTLDFAWNSNDGKIYDLQSCDSLTSTNWVTHGSYMNIAATLPTNSLNGVATDGPVRFFRVIER